MISHWQYQLVYALALCASLHVDMRVAETRPSANSYLFKVCQGIGCAPSYLLSLPLPMVLLLHLRSIGTTSADPAGQHMGGPEMLSCCWRQAVVTEFVYGSYQSTSSTLRAHTQPAFNSYRTIPAAQYMQV
jgi:hypothetical protein